MSRNQENKMQDWHRIFVQAIMSRGYMSGNEVFTLVRDICDKFNGTVGFPTVRLDKPQEEIKRDIAELIENFFQTSNQYLEKIKFEIKKGYEEVKTEDNFTQYYTLVPIEENEQIAKLQKNFTEPELEFLKLICEYIIEDRPDRMETETKLINLCQRGGYNASKKKLTSMEADRVLQLFVAEGYLTKMGGRGQKGGRLGLGARLMMELEGWLQKNEEMEKCAYCNKPVAISVSCVNKSCESSFHRYCVSKSKCTVCKQSLKIDGVAAKR